MNHADELTFEMHRSLNSEIRPGESLVWSGRRVGFRGLLFGGVLMGIFGLLFASFALFWMAMAFHIGSQAQSPSGIGMIFPLFGLPFLLVGIGIATEPYRMWRNAQRSFYAITNQRAISFEAGMFGAMSVKSYGPEDLTDLKRNQYADGTGALIFQDYTTYHQSSRRRLRRRQVQEGFMGVADVAEVERTLRQALNLED